MAEYQPTSRRPIAECSGELEMLRPVLCASWNSSRCDFVFVDRSGADRGNLFLEIGRETWLLIIAPLFCYLRLWFNMLDGLVAFAAGKASRAERMLNDLPGSHIRRVIFVGVAHSGSNESVDRILGGNLSVLTSYVGLFGQALGVQRQFSGIMSKPWRMVALQPRRMADVCI